MKVNLSTKQHDRDCAGFKYVYPVVSRRSGGLSVGININTNNACNWRCVYCQVPHLTLGAAPEIDFTQLIDELRQVLYNITHGDFYQRFQVPEHLRALKDIAFSGNGEPTSSKAFAQLIATVGEVAHEANVLAYAKLVLITNGSLLHQPWVQTGLIQLQALQGEVWFKLDSVTPQGRKLLNHTTQPITHAVQNLRSAARLCRIKLQTCVVNFDALERKTEQAAYLACLATLRDVPLEEIMLYTLARPALQPEATQLHPATTEQLQQFANEIQALGFKVSCY